MDGKVSQFEIAAFFIMEEGRKRRCGVVNRPDILSTPKRTKLDNSEQKLSFMEWSPEDVHDYFIHKEMISVASILKGV